MPGTSLQAIQQSHDMRSFTSVNIQGGTAGEALMKAAMQGTQQASGTLNVTVLGVEMRKFVPGLDDPSRTDLWIP